MSSEIDLLRVIEEFATREGMTAEYIDHDLTGNTLSWNSSKTGFCQIEIACWYATVECTIRLQARVDRRQGWTPWEGLPFAVLLDHEGLTPALEMLRDARIAAEQLSDLLASDGRVDVRRSVEQLDHTDGLTRYVAALALTATRPEVQILGLADYLHHEDPVVRSQVVRLIGQRGTAHDRAMLALMRSDPDPYVRGTAARAFR